MTENQPPKDENSQETMNSGKLETVQNIDLDNPSPTDSILTVFVFRGLVFGHYLNPCKSIIENTSLKY